MITLKGSEKQIKWAESIRNKAIEICNEILANCTNKKVAQNVFNTYLFSNDSSAWWIDHRDYVACNTYSTMCFLDWCIKNKK